MRRTDGKNGWKKMPCPWSSTGWSWGKVVNEQVDECTCEPCKAPKGRDYRNNEKTAAE